MRRPTAPRQPPCICRGWSRPPFHRVYALNPVRKATQGAHWTRLCVSHTPFPRSYDRLRRNWECLPDALLPPAITRLNSSQLLRYG
jgi:hypothetical protein